MDEDDSEVDDDDLESDDEDDSDADEGLCVQKNGFSFAW